MARNKKLIEQLNKVPKNYNGWTDTALDCYQKAYKCKKCPLSKFLETKCKMKYTVLELISVWGIESLQKALKERENAKAGEDTKPQPAKKALQKVCNSILAGNLTLDAISANTNYSRRSITFYLPYLYKLKGFKPKKEMKIEDKIFLFSKYLQEMGIKPDETIINGKKLNAIEGIIEAVKCGNTTIKDIVRHSGLAILTVRSRLPDVFDEYGVKLPYTTSQERKLKELYKVLKENEEK